MLEKGADAVMKAQKAKGRAYGVQRTGVTLESITHKKPYKTGDGKAVVITFQGENKNGDRNAAIAFYNEYGVPGRGIKPRPFMRDANEESADAVTAAMEKPYDEFLKSKNLKRRINLWEHLDLSM